MNNQKHFFGPFKATKRILSYNMALYEEFLDEYFPLNSAKHIEFGEVINSVCKLWIPSIFPGCSLSSFSLFENILEDYPIIQRNYGQHVRILECIIPKNSRYFITNNGKFLSEKIIYDSIMPLPNGLII